MMMRLFKVVFILMVIPGLLFSQKKSNLNHHLAVVPSVIKTPIGFSISAPLREAPIFIDKKQFAEEFYMNKHRDREINPNIYPPDFSKAIPDPGEQIIMGEVLSGRSLQQNFPGQNSSSYPPDCSGTVGSDYYFQVVNVTYQIFNKSDGSSAAGPSNLNSIFNSGLPGATCNSGDPIVLWDEQADRWLFAEFSLCGSNDYMLIAVSTTNDPTGTWYSWSYDVADMPDYMKFGIWQDGYYMATNTSAGNDVYVFDRDAMISGSGSPVMIGFDNPNRPTTFDGFHCLLPLDNDGAWAPAGTPGQFITIADDGQSNPADELRIYELDADWTTPSNSTFSMVQQLPVNAFNGNFSNDWNNIPQPGTAQKLDGISTVLMFRAQYRNFNGIQKIVCNHTIAESATESAIRWYELEKTTGSWSISQQGTYNPDDVSRWNGSIAMNDNGEIAMGYSVSDGTSIYPGIRYCAQTTNAPQNTMDVAEVSIWDGSFSQTGINRWGDYSNISVDPGDGTTFWYTNEYKSSSSHGTRIASFTVPLSCIAPTVQAAAFSVAAIHDNDLTINWTRGNGTHVLVIAREAGAVNQGPVTGTNYNANASFGDGDAIGSGNYVLYNGTGTSVITTSLQAGTAYHFSIHEYSISDFCYLSPGLTGNATTSGVAPCNLCNSNGNTDYETSTTFVGLNTLSNASAKPGAYSDYTNLSTNLGVAEVYLLNVRVNTDGNYTVNTIVWVDWNQDCDFSDSGETYDLGTATNTSDGATSLSPLSITVPVDAVLDNTIMRVSTKYSSDPTSCETGFDGEVEDYTLTLVPGQSVWIGNTVEWNAITNWENGIVPTSSFVVTIPAVPTGGHFPTIPLGINAVCYSITLENGSTITINGNLEVIK